MHEGGPDDSTSPTSLAGRAAAAFDRVAARWHGTALVGALSLAIGVALSAGGTIPHPRVHDEFSYLLASDTFAHGRLTNPTHPMWQHFESFHIIQQPTYASKYPVGQGLTMAVGQALTGYPIVGVWLTIALACMTITWMLRPWVSPRWAVIGGMLAAAHPMVMRWEHNYWGGGVAMLGGALVVGAARRVIEKPTVGPATLLAIGLVILANSRPFEGLVVALLIGLSFLVWMVSGRRRGIRGALTQLLVPAALVLVPSFAWVGYYNWRVTGDPLEMPYMRHEATYVIFGVLDGVRRSPPVYRHDVMRRYFAGEELDEAEEERVHRENPRRRRLTFIPDRVDPYRRKLQTLLQAYGLNPGLLLALVGLPLLFVRDRWARWPVAVLALGVTTILIESFMLPHYGAPLAGLAFLVAVLCLRELSRRRWGRPLVVVSLSLSVLACGFEYWRSTRRAADDTHEWYRHRAAIAAALRASGEPSLVVVRYRPNHHPGDEWVYNDADIDGAPVVWAREMDPASNQKLFEYFADRRIYVLDADARHPQPVPLPPPEGTDTREWRAPVLPRWSD